MKIFKLINSVENNLRDKHAIARLISNHITFGTDLRQVNDEAMRQTIKRYMQMVFERTNSIESFNNEVQQFENSRFIAPFYRWYFQDVKAHFIQRAFGRELNSKILGYGAQALTSAVASNDMTIYQIVPTDL